MKNRKLTLVSLLTVVAASVASATPTAAEAFASDVASQGATIAGYAATTMGAGLAVFAVIYGGRIALKGFRAIAK
mgnify:CR=1 FL=1